MRNCIWLSFCEVYIFYSQGIYYFNIHDWNSIRMEGPIKSFLYNVLKVFPISVSTFTMKVFVTIRRNNSLGMFFEQAPHFVSLHMTLYIILYIYYIRYMIYIYYIVLYYYNTYIKCYNYWEEKGDYIQNHRPYYNYLYMCS